MRETLLKKLAAWHVNHPWRMAAVAAIITIVFLGLAGQLSMTMRTSDLLPEGDSRVVQFNRIIDEFSTSVSLMVVTQGEEGKIKAFANALAPRILELRDLSQNAKLEKQIADLSKKTDKLRARGGKEKQIADIQAEIEDLAGQKDKKLFQRVDYKSDIEFLRDHALMLVKAEDLETTKGLFTDPNLAGLLRNLNNSMEAEYVGREESISTREKEDGAWTFLDGIQSLVAGMQASVRGEEVPSEDIHYAADKFLFGEPYMLSYDKQALIMIAVPNFTLMDRDWLMAATELTQELVDSMLPDFPGVTAGLSGDIAREHDEQVYSTQSAGYGTLGALAVILIMLIIAFRMWIAPVFAVATLIVGLIWALGAAFLVVGQLNMFTAMMSVVIIGIGIDFAIHLITGFTEWRAAGDSIAQALEKTFLKSGKGIITGAVTTAFAFLALVISSATGMREMGIVMGVGLLAILLATLVFLPILLVLRERRVDRKRQKTGRQAETVRRDISMRPLGAMGDWLGKRYLFTIGASLVLTALLVWSAFQVTFDRNWMNMEPDGLTSIALRDTIMEKFDLSTEYALVLTDDIAQSRDLSEKYRELSSVAFTTDISVYLPTPAEQRERIPHLEEVRGKMRSAAVRRSVRSTELASITDEIDRLGMNLMEMQDMAFLGGQDKVDDKCKLIIGDPDKPGSRNLVEELWASIETDGKKSTAGLSQFQREFAPYFKESVLKMASTEPIEFDRLPETILDRYGNTDRDLFLVTVYPTGDLYSDTDALDRFVDDLERISDRATGMPPLAVAMIRIFGRDGRNAMMLTLVIVFILLWVDFKNYRHALMAMVPLGIGIFWLVGVMNLVGMQFTIMAMMGLPMIIGIGIDDGVHILHRWRNEGNGKLRTIFSSTGKAIFLTSLTTMFAFGSLGLSSFPAWAQFGMPLFIGVGTCFLTSVIILPGIIGWIEKRDGTG